jgi:Stealth protein CR2, conserved region 2/Stealth protein CR1, conserved region 1
LSQPITLAGRGHPATRTVIIEFMENDTAVDIVYLWVDGSDPTWRAKRRHASHRLGGEHLEVLAQYGNVEGRFRDNQELRYSLRALTQFFPDHGHVYLVTDAQVPEWLANSERLTVIDHHDLIPQGCLPTFDSGNIESYIHRIPGLSERFLYLNDDVFFGAPVRVDDWFWDGGFYTAWSDDAPVTDEPMRRDATALENACRLSNQWLSDKSAQQASDSSGTVLSQGYRPTFRTFAHAPRPMLRSVMFELESLAPELFAMARSTVFRAWDKPTIVSDFVIRWAIDHGLARLRDYSHLYVPTGEEGESTKLDLLASAVGALHFFCINDTTDDARAHDPRLTKALRVLQQLFPKASRFERA